MKLLCSLNPYKFLINCRVDITEEKCPTMHQRINTIKLTIIKFMLDSHEIVMFTESLQM